MAKKDDEFLSRAESIAADEDARKRRERDAANQRAATLKAQQETQQQSEKSALESDRRYQSVVQAMRDPRVTNALKVIWQRYGKTEFVSKKIIREKAPLLGGLLTREKATSVEVRTPLSFSTQSEIKLSLKENKLVGESIIRLALEMLDLNGMMKI